MKRETKTALLFDLQKRESEARPKYLQVRQRRFRVHYGAVYILITELTSEHVSYYGRLKPFQVLTEEMEKEKGMSYNLRKAIIERSEGA